MGGPPWLWRYGAITMGDSPLLSAADRGGPVPREKSGKSFCFFFQKEGCSFLKKRTKKLSFL
jgi:hypothetical protein